MQSEAMSTKMLGDTLQLTNRHGKSLIVSLVNIINIRWSCHGDLLVCSFFFTNWIFSTLSTGRKSKNGHHNWKRGFIIQIISLTGTTVIFKRWASPLYQSNIGYLNETNGLKLVKL